MIPMSYQFQTAINHHQVAAVAVRLGGAEEEGPVDVEVESWTTAGDVIRGVLQRRLEGAGHDKLI